MADSSDEKKAPDGVLGEPTAYDVLEKDFQEVQLMFQLRLNWLVAATIAEAFACRSCKSCNRTNHLSASGLNMKSFSRRSESHTVQTSLLHFLHLAGSWKPSITKHQIPGYMHASYDKAAPQDLLVCCNSGLTRLLDVLQTTRSASPRRSGS